METPSLDNMSLICDRKSFHLTRINMVTASRYRVKHRAVGALLVLSVVVLVPSSAEARCGHDVTSYAGRSIAKSFSDLDLLKQSARDLSVPLSWPPRRDRPCSGPSCSQNRGFPDAPLPSVPPRHEHWCLSVLPVPPIGADRFGRVTGVAPLHAIHFGLLLDRPPRVELATQSS